MSHAIGANLRRIRTGRDITVSGLARSVGLSREYVTRIEQGRKVPSLGVVKRLAAGLGVPPSALLDGTDNEDSTEEVDSGQRQKP